jgi:hypothetical protein
MRLTGIGTPPLADARLDPEHRNFLAAMTFGEHGYPMDRDMHAGIGGTYRLRRPAEERD